VVLYASVVAYKRLIVTMRHRELTADVLVSHCKYAAAIRRECVERYLAVRDVLRRLYCIQRDGGGPTPDQCTSQHHIDLSIHRSHRNRNDIER
jgi:hypothetical protein